jgi:Mg-chelatase subunit ChlD
VLLFATGGAMPRESLATSQELRVVILFDTSGSMLQNDPQQLSRTAAKLFLDLARPADTLGLIAFSDRAVPLVPLTSLSAPVIREGFHAQLRALAFTGKTTDLAAALQAGLASFPATATGTSRDLVLLLTDGRLDLGPARRAEEPGALATIRQTLLPQYRQRGITLYTIAFTDKADQELLQEMA